MPKTFILIMRHTWHMGSRWYTSDHYKITIVINAFITPWHQGSCSSTAETYCCIRCGPGQERILDIVPGGTELGTQVKTGSLAGRTHTHSQ